MKSKMRYEAGDYEFVANPADFIPVDPNDNHDDLSSEKMKTFLCVVCQVTLILFSVTVLAVAYAAFNEANMKQQSVDFSIPQIAVPLPRDYFKLKQKCDRIHQETHLLKGQFLDLIRWRDNLSWEMQSKINSALDLYDADKTGSIDFALGTDGGFVTSTPDTQPYEIAVNRLFMGLISIRQFSNPQLLIQPGVLPGQCFAFVGDEGRIRIKLTRKIVITSVTLEHVHKNLVEDVSSAPKTFKIIGLQSGENDEGDLLGQFQYRIEDNALQTFNLTRNEVKASYQHVELHVLSNYGNAKYTCIYRFRVHGIPVD